jgi:predicted nucleotidyltransferase
MDIQTIKPEVKKYLKNVSKHIRITDALLYGSFAEGRAQDASDVDIIVLSDDFINVDPDERSRILYRASVGFPYDLHVYGYTPEELKNASPLTALGQLKKNKTISIS